MDTEKLFYQDPYLKEFPARILRKEMQGDGRWKIVLDRTAFYPEGGGQPCDLGFINDAHVLDVRSENGSIIHTTDSDPGENEVIGRLDWKRRFDHMQQHTGEHILSGIFLEKFNAQNVGFHLTQHSCQIDVTLDILTPEQVHSIEDAANDVIFSNVPITARFYAEEEMAGMPMRKEPGKEFAEVRLVSIENCDRCPCGGTHVRSTGDVGLIKIRSWEKRKNNLRIDFVSGGRALADYRLKHDVVSNLSARLSTPPEGVLTAFEKQSERIDGVSRQLSLLRKEYHAELAPRLLADATPIHKTRIITHVFTGYSSADLTDFAGRITATPDTVALLAGVSTEDNRSSFLFAAAVPLSLPMNDLLRAALAPAGGKGGGNATQAQGGAPTANASDILAFATEMLRSSLQT